MNPSLIVESDKIPWRDSPHAGVQWKKLSFDRETGESVVLLRFDPGASYGAHRHPAGERYFVLEGSLTDGGRRYGAGTYVHHDKGSVHQPTSPEGCQILVWLDQPIEEL